MTSLLEERQSRFVSRFLGGRVAVLFFRRQCKGGFYSSTFDTLEATDAVRCIELLIDFYSHAATTPTEIALDAFLGSEPQVKKAESVEKSQKTAQRT